MTNENTKEISTIFNQVESVADTNWDMTAKQRMILDNE